MEQNKSNITIKQRHEAIIQELHPLLMDVKEKLKADTEKNGEREHWETWTCGRRGV